MVEGPTSDVPPRRRASWSLKSIVENVAGKPITDFQDPDRPVHPYLQVKGVGVSAAHAPPPQASAGEPPLDPVGRLYPPLVGAPGREFHGPENEHHAETLDRHRAPPSAVPGRADGPLHRPERLYLHYLLLHMDRLNDASLRYLRTALDEEMAHRAAAAAVRTKGGTEPSTKPTVEPPADEPPRQLLALPAP